MKTLLLTSFLLIQGRIFAAESVYNLDPSHAKVGFEVAHMVISNVEGRFTKFDGTLKKGNKLSDLKINANIDVNSINTDDVEREKHLKAADFFDAEKYPKMTFESTSVSGTEKALKIKGKLTIKNITKEVTIDGKLSKEIKDPWGNTRIAISGKTKINRQDYGLTFNKAAEFGPVVGDEVTILLTSEAILQK